MSVVYRSPGVQVLVVSADPSLRTAFLEGLEGVARVSMTTVEDAGLQLEDLIRVWPASLPLLVILDLANDGYGLLQSFADDPRLRAAPLVALLPACGSDVQRTLALDLANGVLRRPDDPPTLALAVCVIRALWLEAARLPFER